MSAVLSDILAVLGNPVFEGDPSISIEGVTHDSRKVQPGWAFAAVPGEVYDGHNFIDQAVEKGASLIIAQRRSPTDPRDVNWLMVPSTRRALGPIASAVYRDPTAQLSLVGITGTNGKTTLAFLLEAIVRAAGGSPGVIGTITHRWGGKEQSAGHTTPEASDIQWFFRQMVDAGATHAIIETSSHGLHQGRLDGCRFDVGVFTNLTQDHLDYHGTMEEYFQAKRILFDRMLPASGKAHSCGVVNLDDPFGLRLAREITHIPMIGFGTSGGCAVRPEKIDLSAEGIEGIVQTPTRRLSVRSRLTGSFNLLNILAAIAVAEQLGVADQAIVQGMEEVVSVPGRLERVFGQGGAVFVDYAHTPNALQNVLNALQRIRTGRIVTIMGCGGDRDKTKRPIMGREAAAGSNFVIVTSDNPRSENPLDIIDQVVEGVRKYGFSLLPDRMNDHPLPSGYFRIIPDRREAIAWAIGHLGSDDILLVAGKGHETYQEIKGIRHPFDDREVVSEELEKRSALQGKGEASSPKAKGDRNACRETGGRA